MISTVVALALGLTAICLQAAANIPDPILLPFHEPAARHTNVLGLTITLVDSIFAVRRVIRIETGIVFKG